MLTEKELQISPIVTESVVHNTKVSFLLASCASVAWLAVQPPTQQLLTTPQTLSNLQSLTASLFGVAAGILGLESYGGFLFYIAFTLLTALVFYILRVAPESVAAGKPAFDTSRYFRGSLELWTSGLFGGLAGFILTWTLFYGLVRA